MELKFITHSSQDSSSISRADDSEQKLLAFLLATCVRLAGETDEVFTRLFHPLVLQCISWYTLGAMQSRPHCALVRRVLLAALTGTRKFFQLCKLIIL